MPTYEYQCTKCSYRFEKFQMMSEEPLKVCPKCKGRVQRLISSGNGFIFKGSGFYETDYRSDSYNKAKTSDSKPTKTETKKKPTKS